MWNTILAGVFTVLASFVGGWFIQGGVRRRMRNSITADLDLIAKLPDGDDRRRLSELTERAAAKYVRWLEGGSRVTLLRTLAIASYIVAVVLGVVSSFSVPDEVPWSQLSQWDRAIVRGSLGAAFLGVLFVMVLVAPGVKMFAVAFLGAAQRRQKRKR